MTDIRAASTIAAMAATGVLLSACSMGADPVSFDSFGHVHAVEMDVQAGTLYVASHNGVWRIPVPETVDEFPDQDAITSPQVANAAQDTMGFTITNDGAMFASGHPHPTEKPEFDPPLLGLMRSTDGADTWDHVSLQEEADFHALEAVPLADSEFRIYGYDPMNGSLRISDDTGKSWRTGLELDVIDLAARAEDPDILYATTSSGLQRSDDAGATFTPSHPGPALALIEPLTSGLVGVDTAGYVWRMIGDSLSQVGSVSGQFEAFGAFEDVDNVWLLVSDEDGIGVSKDWGATWTNVVPR